MYKSIYIRHVYISINHFKSLFGKVREASRSAGQSKRVKFQLHPCCTTGKQFFINNYKAYFLNTLQNAILTWNADTGKVLHC